MLVILILLAQKILPEMIRAKKNVLSVILSRGYLILIGN